MANLDCYNIIFKSLEIGNHTFEYELDNNFFKSLEDAEIKEGSLSAVVTVLKNEKNAELNIQIDGIVQIPCDRCLDEMTQEIEVDEDLLVQFTNAGEETENTLFIVASPILQIAVFCIPEHLQTQARIYTDNRCDRVVQAGCRLPTSDLRRTTNEALKLRSGYATRTVPMPTKNCPLECR